MNQSIHQTINPVQVCRSNDLRRRRWTGRSVAVALLRCFLSLACLPVWLFLLLAVPMDQPNVIASPSTLLHDR